MPDLKDPLPADIQLCRDCQHLPRPQLTEFEGRQTGCWMRCTGCGAEGPYKETEEKAREGWNDLNMPFNRMRLALRSILSATDREGVYANRALHLAAGEGLGLEGYSSED